jgi:hypothetical protein
MVPLHFSSMPYNIDGFPLVKISEVIIETGDVPSPSSYGGLIAYNLKLPVFSLVLSSFSSILGIEPLTLLPYFCALIGSLAVLFIYLLTLNLTRNRIAGFSAGLFAALTGLFVYVTTAAMKQLLAIVFLIMIYYLFSKRKCWRCRMILCIILILLPFTHHLTTLIALLALSLAIAGATFRENIFRSRTIKSLALDVVTGPVILLSSLLYYRDVNLEFASEVGNLDDAALLGCVFILMAVVTKLISETVQSKPWFFLGKEESKEVGWSSIFDEKVLVLIIGIGALYLNSKINIFTGGVMTSDTLLQLIFPYLILAVFGVIGFNVLRYSRFPQRHVIVGMFLAPLCVILFGVLRGLDIFNFTLVYRSYNFIDIPLAMFVGVGIAYIFSKLRTFSKGQKEFRALPVGVLVVFCILCTASLPLAYNNEAAFGIQEITYEYEFEGMNWASEGNVNSVITDQRYGDIISPYFGINADRTGPWKIRDNDLDSGDVVLLSNYWTDGGAQMSILGRVLFEESQVDEFLEHSDVIYVGGPNDREMVIVIVR